MSWAYSETVKDHFMNPRNLLTDDEAFDADAEGTTGNVKCGDQMRMLLKVDPEQLTITDCRWQTYGCASAIASTSVLSEMVKGMPLDEAMDLTPDQITAELEGLPEHKIHCSVLGDKALRAAINDYYQRAGRPDKVRKSESRIVCQCMNVTDDDIEDAVLEGVREYLQLQEHTKLGTVCGQCKDDAVQVMNSAIERHFSKS